MPIELSKKKTLQMQVATQTIMHTMVFLSKQTKAKQFFSPCPTTMLPHEHDCPDPNLIIQGVHCVQPFGGLQKLWARYLDGQINVDLEIMKKYIGDFDFDFDDYSD